MGRYCGWLTATTAYEYRKRLNKKTFLPDILLAKERWDIDAVYIPEIPLNINKELERLNRLMDEKDNVNIFLSEGAGIETIVAEMESKGEEIRRDAFGHVRIDEINPGQWFAGKFSKLLKAEKTLVQKSGYFARSAAPNKRDLDLIFQTADMALEAALNGQSGVIGMDEDNNNKISVINFSRIKGGKPFDTNQKWFQEMMSEIGQIR